ncbi:MAG: FAD-dependent oxidoreductase, partial [Pseudomonadota bacterium]
MTDLPKKARAVIIGGGVIGCSVAYHLAKLGWKDILLLERKKLCCGTTWHAAGLIAQLRATFNMTKLARYSAELYVKLEEETGVATGYKRNGSIALALSNDRLEEFARGASMAKNLDVQAEMLTVEDCASSFPLANLDGVAGGLFLPEDGQADPMNIALALAAGARQAGVTIKEDVRVTGIRKEKGRAVGVDTEFGPVDADVVVNAAGMWGR